MIGATKTAMPEQMFREGDRAAAGKQDRRIPEAAGGRGAADPRPSPAARREQGIAEVAGQRAAEVKNQRKRREQRQAGEREHDERGFRGVGLQSGRVYGRIGNDSPQIDVSHCRTRDAPTTAGPMAQVGMPEPGVRNRFRRISVGAGADGGSRGGLRPRLAVAVRPLLRRPELGSRPFHRRHRRMAGHLRIRVGPRPVPRTRPLATAMRVRAAPAGRLRRLCAVDVAEAERDRDRSRALRGPCRLRRPAGQRSAARVGRSTAPDRTCISSSQPRATGTS